MHDKDHRLVITLKERRKGRYTTLAAASLRAPQDADVAEMWREALVVLDDVMRRRTQEDRRD